MRLKPLLTVLMLLSTMVPLAMFWAWPHSQVLENEFEEVEERHLLLARNLGAALERYHRDLVSTFDFVARELLDGRRFWATNLMSNLEIQHICLFDLPDGTLRSQAAPPGKLCPPKMPESRRPLFEAIARPGQIVLSEVTLGPNRENVIYMVKDNGTSMAVASFTTRYFFELGRHISFGIEGHSAIVDQAGNVLAHPTNRWVADRKNIAEISAVKRMLNGESGVERFYSPALKAEMIAGFTSVAGAGWGVMVPQPVVELHAKANAAEKSALAIMALGFVIAACLATALASWLAKPMEKLAASADEVGKGHWTTISGKGWLPKELAILQSAFVHMVERLKNSATRVNQLAYADTVTGLGNRSYFTQRAGRWLSSADNQEAAILFIDLDDFKPVNDCFGHDAGDVVLACIADRLVVELEAPIIAALCETDPIARELQESEVIVSRLAGDEFAVLLPGLFGAAEALAVGARIIELIAAPIPGARVRDRATRQRRRRPIAERRQSVERPTEESRCGNVRGKALRQGEDNYL